MKTVMMLIIIIVVIIIIIIIVIIIIIIIIIIILIMLYQLSLASIPVDTQTFPLAKKIPVLLFSRCFRVFL